MENMKKLPTVGSSPPTRIPVSLASCWAWLFNKRKFSRKKTAPQSRSTELAGDRQLPGQWHQMHRRLPTTLTNVNSPYLVRGSCCLFKSPDLCLPRCPWHPGAEPQVGSVSAPPVTRAHHSYLQLLVS